MVASNRKANLSFASAILLEASLSAGETEFQLIYNFFDQDGDNAFSIPSGKTGQDTKVVEPVLYIAHEINENIDISADAAYDTWTSASDREFDAFTSASFAQDQKRKEYSVGVKLKDDLDSKNLSANYSKSDEWDYHSESVSLGVEYKLADNNANLSFSSSFYRDYASTYNYLEETTDENQRKDTDIYQIGFSQFLTRKSLALVSLGLSSQSGAMEGSLNSVDINGVRVQESLPNSRKKKWLSLTYIHSILEESSIHLNFIAFKDDWKVSSYSLESNVYSYFFEEQGLLNLFYRYYRQDGYENFAKSFEFAQLFMTSDSDYQKFASHSAGAIYQHELETDHLVYILTAGASHYLRSNNLYFSTLQSGVGIRF